MHAVAKQLSKCDPGIVVQLLDLNSLHAALQLPHSPLPAGNDVNSSADSFRQWLIAQALASPGVTGANQVSPECVAFHHLTPGMTNHIIYQKWLIVRWVVEIQTADIAPFCLVLLLEGLGRGKCDITVAAQVFY